MHRSILLAFLFAASPAHAGDMHKSLGNGLELSIDRDRNELVVAKDRTRAALVSAVSIQSATVDAKSGVVDVVVEDFSCATNTTKHTWTLGHLEARVANAAAYALHKRKDYKAAVPGFARAVAADPTWKIAAFNLASAHQLLGDKHAAVEALAPWLAAEPVATYVKVTADPELRPLLDHVALKAVRGKPTRAIKLTQYGVDGDVAFSAERGLVAVMRTEASWGACMFKTDLEVHDVASGKLVASTPVIAWNETSSECDVTGGSLLERARPAVASRLKTLGAMLGELGFVTPKVEAGKIQRTDDKFKVQFAARKLGIAAQDGTARVLRKNDVLATAAVQEIVDEAVFIPAANAFVVWSVRAGREGCEETDPTQVTVMRVAPAKAAP